MKKSIFGIVTAFVSIASANIICSDSTTDFRFEQYQQEGGACCGRSSESVTYKNKILKKVETINPFPDGNGGKHTDSNPRVKVTLGSEVLLGNAHQDNAVAYADFAMNITLENMDNKSVLPGEKNSLVVKSVVCTESHSLVPRP